MPTVTFQPDGVVADAEAGESIFDVARRVGLKVETACVGKGTCGLCRVVVVDGDEHLSDYNDVEEKHLGNVYWLTKIRLSCQAIYDGAGDVVVEVVLKD